MLFVLFFIPVCANPFSKGARGQVKPNHFSTFSMGLVDYISVPEILSSFSAFWTVCQHQSQSWEVSPRSTKLSVRSSRFVEAQILCPQNSDYDLVNKASDS